MESGGGQINTYFKSLDNVFIYFTNLSPYYIFSVLVSILAVISVCWLRATEKILQVDTATTNSDVPGDDLQPEHDEKLQTMGVKLKESTHNLANNFVEAANNEEILEKDFNGLAQDGNVHCQDMTISQKDTPGGDGSFDELTSEERCVEKLHKHEDQDPVPSLIMSFKKARQAVLYERLTSNLSEQQIQEEKEIEASQIAAIWDLLRQQKDQFNIGTEEELQHQLHLYRL